MDLKSLTQESLTSTSDAELISVHDHIHRVFRVSDEKALLSSAHNILSLEIESRSLAHSTPMPFHPTGLYLKHPHSRLIYDSKKSFIAQSSPSPIEGQHILTSKEDNAGLAYGLVSIGPPVTIECEEFDAQFNLHRVTTKEREKWWKGATSLLLYPITSFIPYSHPKSVEVPAGVQMIMQEVKFMPEEDKEGDREEDEGENNAKSLEVDSPEVSTSSEEKVMPWKASDAQSHTKLANTPAKQSRWAEVANRVLADCVDGGDDVKECEVSAIRQANSVIKDGEEKEEGEDKEEKEMVESRITEVISDMVRQQVLTELSRLNLKEVIPSDEVVASEENTESAASESASEEEAKSSEVALPEVQDKEYEDTEEDREVDAGSKEEPGEYIVEKPSMYYGTSGNAPEKIVLTSSSDKAGRRIRKSMLERLEEAFSTLKEIIGWAKEPDEPDAKLPLPMVFKSKDGAHTYFVIWPTNSYFDREEEAFHIKSLHDFVDRMDNCAVKSRAQFWHLPHTEFGDIVWQDVIENRFLMQVGVFDDTPVGNAFESFFTKYPEGHPVIAPEGWGASHGFHYNPVDRQDGVYDWQHSTESTVLPLSAAANLLNPSPIVLGGKEMNDKRREALRVISDEVGIDLVGYAEATGKAAREIADEKVEHKMKKEDVKKEEMDEEDEEDVEGEDVEKDPKDPKKDPKKSKKEVEKEVEKVEVTAEVVADLSQDSDNEGDTKEVDGAESASEDTPEATPEVQNEDKSNEVKSAEVDVDAITAKVVGQIVEQLGLKELSVGYQAQIDALQSLQSRLDTLESTDEKKIAENVESEVPRYGAFAWLQASKASGTVLTEKEKAEFKSKAPNVGNSVIGNLVNGL